MSVLPGLRIDPKRVECTAEALGAEIAADECRRVEAEVSCAPTLYLGLDGTGVSVRALGRHGRAGKQPDGTSKTCEVERVTVLDRQETRCQRPSYARSGLDRLLCCH